MTTFPDHFRSDFNTASEGIPMADILWRDAAGDNVLWLMNNNTRSAVSILPALPPDWHLKAAADFDLGDGGNADILWQNDNGALSLWHMNGETVNAIHALPDPGPSWHVVGDNDFNSDGADDIFFQNDNGALAIWTITSAAAPTISGMFAGTQDPGPAWHVVGTGDTNKDGLAGVLWQNDNGALALWENPTFGTSTFTFNSVAALPRVDPSWHVEGMADVTGDGAADVVFQNDNGAVVVWDLTFLTPRMILIDLNPGPSWHIAGMRNMDGDLNADILFQNDNGAAAVWENYQPLGSESATFDTVLAIAPNPNPNGHVWDLL